MKELKLCPFCGKMPTKPLPITMLGPIMFTAWDEHNEDDVGVDWWEIRCLRCKITMSKSTKKEVVKAWNTRTFPPPHDVEEYYKDECICGEINWNRGNCPIHQ
jgi:hypothetical protein